MHTRDSQVNQPLEVIADTSMIETFKNTVKSKKIKVSTWKTKKKNAVENQLPGYKWTPAGNLIPGRNWDGSQKAQRSPQML